MPTGDGDPCRNRVPFQRQKNARHAAGLSRQLQPAPCDQIEARQLRHRRRHARRAQRLLERPDAIGRVERAHQQQAARRHGLPRKARTERFKNSGDPNQWPQGAFGQRQPIGEPQRQRRRWSRLSANMVKAGDRQPAALEMRVNPRQARWPECWGAPTTFQRAKPGAEGG